jgi:uncharacterized protein YbcI
MDALHQPATGRLNQAVTNAVVGIHSDCVGRGPTKAKAFCSDNVVVVVLEDTLTKGERNLVANGRADAALEMRRQLQHTMRTRLVETIESLTGRVVIALLTDSQIRPDVASHVFVLDGALGESDSPTRLDGPGARPSEQHVALPPPTTADRRPRAGSLPHARGGPPVAVPVTRGS